MKKMIITAVVVAALSGCASNNKQLEETNSHLLVIESQLAVLNQSVLSQRVPTNTEMTTDRPNTVCWLNDKAYSAGSIAYGKVCADENQIRLSGGGSIPGPKLVWKPYVSKR